MPAATRTVRHLRLRAGDAGDVRRGALLLEDALRTASLPDAGGRIVAVRRLAVGAIDPRAPPQTLALRLERQLAGVAASAVHGADPAAAQAESVWFADALEAHTALALRIASGEAADAWFWPLAVRAWSPDLSSEQMLRRLALAVAALPEAPVALPLWTASLVHAGHRAQLTSSLHGHDMDGLARAAGVRLPQSVVNGPAKHLAAEALVAVLLRCVPPGPTHDRATPESRSPDREVLPGAQSAVSAARQVSVPSGHGDHGRFANDIDMRDEAMPSVPQAESSIRPAATDRLPHIGAPASPRLPDTRQAPESRSSPGEINAMPRSRASDGRVGQRRIRDANSARPQAATDTAWHEHTRSFRSPYEPSRHELSRHEPTPAPERQEGFPWPSPTSTVAGGLLFLVPLLQRLGYDEWLAAEPAWARWDIAQRMFSTLLARLQVPLDDPAWLIAAFAAPHTSAPPRFFAPSRWRAGLCPKSGSLIVVASSDNGSLFDASGRLLLASWRGSRPRALMPLLRQGRSLPGAAPAGARDLATAWLTACRRWLRRYAGIGLADLVRRPAALALTSTHVDLFFSHHQAEMRVRRAGLDLDPGWVTWLRLVVAFHYDGQVSR